MNHRMSVALHPAPAGTAAVQGEEAHPPVESLGFAQVVDAAERLGTNLGRPEVIALYRRWIRAQDRSAHYLHAAWFNLGAELGRSGETGQAIVAYREALALRPDFHPPAVNLGLLQEQLGQTEDALQSWSQALQPVEARTSLINHRARLLEQEGRLEEAEQELRTSLAHDPRQPDAIQHWVHIRQKLCAWPVLDERAAGLSRDEMLRNLGPLAALALSDRVAVQVAVAAAWIERKTFAPPEGLCPEQGYRHDRIRVGYLSSDFCSHAMSFLIAELFERHDRTRFEVFGYCSSPDDGSAIRQRVIAGFDHYLSVRDIPDEAAARRIRADEIDILVDLNGLTAGSRMQVLRWRPAPVQATYLGFIGPVPVPELDYMFCDDFVVPPAVAHEYRPRPLCVARNYQVNDSRREIGPPVSRASVGLPEGRFVFACFSNHYKITEPMFACWMSILSQVEGSVLWLVGGNVASCRNLRSHAAAAGIEPERIVFAERVDPSEYMARLGLADLFLDTYPYNAGTIASDALRMELPLLTLSGEAFASRMAGRLLEAMGAEHGIAGDFASYLRIAVTLATDRQAWAAYKALFTRTRWAEGVGDVAGFTRQYEAALTRIHMDRQRP